jgi:anti-sigma B factor antagonist
MAGVSQFSDSAGNDVHTETLASRLRVRVAGYNRHANRPPSKAVTSGDSQTQPSSPPTFGGVALGLQLFVRRAADVVIVDLTGIATMGPANDFLDSQLRKLINHGNSKILVNLTDVTQLDSSGIGIIVRAFLSLKHRGASLKLLRPRGNVRLVLETVHLLNVIPTMEDETQGIASFR